jgi:Ca2+-binding RTX toxin-like protein
MSAYWKADEGTGTVANDSTVYNNSGALLNGATWTASAAPTQFSNPFAFSLDGVDDYVLDSDTTGLPAGSAARTISVWSNQDTMTGQQSLVSMGNGNTSNQKFILQLADLSGTTYLFTDGINAANNITLTSSDIPTLGTWHHIAFSFNGAGNWAYYLDGSLRKSGTFTVPINTVTNAVEIGARHDAVNGFYDGRLDDVRIYSSALTAQEIAALAGSCPASSSSSSSMSSSSSISSSSSSSSVALPPTCNGQTATIYVVNNTIVGGPNNGSTFYGTLSGSNGNDVIVGTSSNDRILGNGGNDTICGGAGSDSIDGGTGNDFIAGQTGNDSLQGSDGTDILCGGADYDLLRAGNDNDKLDGGPSFDSLNGDSGTDTCSNGESNNTCEIAASVPECAGF